MPTLIKPTTELAAAAWIASIAGFSASMVGTTLPAADKWDDTGFVQVLTVGGNPGMYVPMNSPVVEIDCWANNLSSNKPPWGKANNLAVLIIAATYDYSNFHEELDVKTGYGTAVIHTAYPTSQPRRIKDDEASYARYQFDLAINWTEVP